jgi:hypothetical protein
MHILWIDLPSFIKWYLISLTLCLECTQFWEWNMDYTIQLGPKDRVTFKRKFIILDPKDVFSTRYQCTWNQKGLKTLHQWITKYFVLYAMEGLFQLASPNFWAYNVELLPSMRPRTLKLREALGRAPSPISVLSSSNRTIYVWRPFQTIKSHLPILIHFTNTHKQNHIFFVHALTLPSSTKQQLHSKTRYIFKIIYSTSSYHIPTPMTARIWQKKEACINTH